MNQHQQQSATLLGILALIIWSAFAAFSRMLAEQLGIFTSAALVLTVGGGVGLLYIALVQRKWHLLFRQPPRHLLLACVLVIVYNVNWYFAIGSAADRAQMLIVSLINYLWPALTLLLSVPILKKRARWYLWPGTVIALGGILVATVQQGDLSLSALLAQWHSAWWIYLVMLIGALCWSLYSNVTRLWMADMTISSMPLFLFVTGLIMVLIRGFVHEQTHWHASLIWILIPAALGPTLLSYAFWDTGMRKGRMVFLVSLSYMTPLLSTAFSGLFLRIMPGINLWIACGLVILGAIICNASIIDQRRTADAATGE